MKILKRLSRMLLLLIVGLYAALALYAWFGSEGVIFQPRPCSYRVNDEFLKIKSADGNYVSAIHLKNPAATYTLLYSHGNAEDIGDLAFLFEDLRKAGFNVFAYDYQGYGASQGKPSEQRAYEDELAAYNYLTQEAGIAPASIILQGHSVGTGPAVDLATKRTVGGLIVESGFVSAFRVLTRWPLLPFDRFNNLAKIGKVRCPVLVLHGRQDEVIPFWQGEMLYAAARQPKQFLWLDRVGHNDISLSGAYLKGIQNFSEFVRQHQTQVAQKKSE